jgi:hypothetical protein
MPKAQREAKMRTMHETIETPILDEVDVLVCGGGMTGFPAAIASARNGARTIMAESEGYLGGTATAGLMNGYAPYFSDGLGHQIVGGIIYEFTERLEKEDALPHHGFTPTDGFCKLQFDPEIFKRVAMAMVRESGASVLLHSHVASPLMDGRRVIGAAFQSRKGRWGILARAIVDATGDGSLAAWAGAPFDEATGEANTLMFSICNIDMDRTAQAMASRMGGEEADRFLAWYRRHGTLSVVIQSDFPDVYQDAVAKGEFPSNPKGIEDGFDMQGIHGLSRKGFAYVFGPMIRGSCLDPVDASRKEADAYERVWHQMRLVRRVPGFEKAVVVQVAPAIGVRRSRSVRCEHELTEEETAEGSRHRDRDRKSTRLNSSHTT